MVINLSPTPKYRYTKDIGYIHAVDSQRKLCHLFAFLVSRIYVLSSFEEVIYDEMGMTKQLYFLNQFPITYTVLDAFPSENGHQTFSSCKALHVLRQKVSHLGWIVNLIIVNYRWDVVDAEYAKEESKINFSHKTTKLGKSLFYPINSLF
jgi:hypothetical protein